MHEVARNSTPGTGGLELGVASYVHMCACTGSPIKFKLRWLDPTGWIWVEFVDMYVQRYIRDH